MFVIVQEELPDIRVLTYDEMAKHMSEISNYVAYGYMLDQGVWRVGRRYVCIATDDIVYNEPGSWHCPAEYLIYNIPNVCSECSSGEFMKGLVCTYCSAAFGCLDCFQSAKECACA